MKKILRGQSERDYLLFVTGLNTGLRISDILSLKYSNLFTESSVFKQYLTISEQKTGKQKKISLNEITKKAIKDYVRNNKLSGDDFIFKSKKGGHINRIQAYKILRAAAEAVGVENFGTHSMRKSFGFHCYQASRHNIGLIMEMFNHSSAGMTLRYIGINQEQKDELYSMVQL